MADRLVPTLGRWPVASRSGGGQANSRCPRLGPLRARPAARGGGLDLPPAAAGAASLNPCDEEIGAEDEEETRFRAAAAEYRALVFCCSTTLALLGFKLHLSTAPARAAPPTRCRSMC